MTNSCFHPPSITHLSCPYKYLFHHILITISGSFNAFLRFAANTLYFCPSFVYNCYWLTCCEIVKKEGIMMWKRALMHLVEMERDVTCVEAHVRGVKQMYVLPSQQVAELDELVEQLQAKIAACQEQVFELSRNPTPSALTA